MTKPFRQIHGAELNLPGGMPPRRTARRINTRRQSSESEPPSVPAERRQPSVPQQTLARIRLLEPLAKECARLKKLVKQALQQGAEVEAGALSAQLEHEEKQYLRWQFMAAQLRLSSEQVKAMRAASPITVRCRLLIRPVTNHCTSSEHYDGHTIHEDDTFEDDDFFDDDDSDEDSD